MTVLTIEEETMKWIVVLCQPVPQYCCEMEFQWSGNDSPCHYLFQAIYTPPTCLSAVASDVVGSGLSEMLCNTCFALLISFSLPPSLRDQTQNRNDKLPTSLCHSKDRDALLQAQTGGCACIQMPLNILYSAYRAITE